MALCYPPRLALAQLPTPLQLMPRVSTELGRGKRIWVKRDDLTGSALGGNKLRKLEFVVAEAQAQGCTALITCGGVQSNHCRATALVGAQLGLKVHLLLRGAKPVEMDGNLLLDYLAGASISYHPARGYSQNLPALAAEKALEFAAAGDKALFLPIGASDGLGIWGYIAAAEELKSDMGSAGIESAHWVCASGSGGTQAGLTLGAALHAVPASVWGVNVCDDEAWFVNKIHEDIAECRRRFPQDDAQPEIRVLDGYVAPGYARATPEVFATIAQVARLEGLILDPVYTGKAFHGMLQELAAGRFGDCDDIIFIHTGGIFGVFPQRDQFNFEEASR